MSIVLRDLSVPELAAGRAMGAQVLAALGFRAGFTHMEWYRTATGEVVFGEIAARPPGARVVDLMNYACDADLYAGWAEAVLHGRLAETADAEVQRGQHLQAGPRRRPDHPRRGPRRAAGPRTATTSCSSTCCRSGAPRRDWRATVMGDGWVVVRHHDLQRVIEMTERFAADLHLYAGS